MTIISQVLSTLLAKSFSRGLKREQYNLYKLATIFQSFTKKFFFCILIHIFVNLKYFLKIYYSMSLRPLNLRLEKQNRFQRLYFPRPFVCITVHPVKKLSAKRSIPSRYTRPKIFCKTSKSSYIVAKN